MPRAKLAIHFRKQYRLLILDVTASADVLRGIISVLRKQLLNMCRACVLERYTHCNVLYSAWLMLLLFVHSHTDFSHILNMFKFERNIQYYHKSLSLFVLCMHINI